MQAAEFIPSCLLTLSSCPVPEEISRGHLTEKMASLVSPSTEMLLPSRIVLNTTRNSVEPWVYHGPGKKKLHKCDHHNLLEPLQLSECPVVGQGTLTWLFDREFILGTRKAKLAAESTGDTKTSPNLESFNMVSTRLF